VLPELPEADTGLVAASAAEPAAAVYEHVASGPRSKVADAPAPIALAGALPGTSALLVKECQ
jgi:hypothetical protein